ncbi:MAG: hypothetical protein IPJ34_06155 [Myxococcales bacterium]|nr:hypothetical protein [Myxococcales bacterium]
MNDVAAGGSFSPSTVRSTIGATSAFFFGTSGGSGFGVGVASGTTTGSGGGGATTTGSVKVTLKRIVATMGAPSRVAGSNFQVSAAETAASTNGASPSSAFAEPTEPSFSITRTSTTTASPFAPAG